MTRDELLAVLRICKVDGDAFGDHEDTHERADTALLAYINDPDIADAYNAIMRWYA